MQSSGGVVPAAEAARAGAWSVLSGPAGGAVGAGLLARISGDGDAIGFDMGGTSCDVCVVEDGEVRRTDSRTIGGRTIQLPMVDVHTVGAGGGSIGWRDRGGALRVGPRSAGAEPGPACYGRGGSEPTVTDANLLLGNLAADSRLAGGVALDADAAAAAVGGLAESLGLDELRDRRGDRPRRQPGDGARPARRHRRARRRPAPLRPAAVRRRRADARRGDRRRARHRADRLPAGGRRPLGARPLRVGPAPRHRPHGDAHRRGAERRADRGRGRRADRRRRRGSRRGPAGGRLRDALRRPGLRAAGAGGARARAGRADRALRGGPRGPLRPPRPRRRGRPRPHPPGDGRRRARAAARGGHRGDAGAALAAGALRRRVGRASGAARRARRRHRGRGAGRLRAAGGDLRPAPRLVVDASTRRARSWRGRDEQRRPDHPAGPDRRAARGLRRDGRGADPLRLLGQHQGAPRLLDRAFRRGRRAGHAGRAHPGPPRLDAGRGRRRARRGAAAGRELDPQRPLSRRHPPAGHHPDRPGLRRAARCSGSRPAAPTMPTSAGRPRAACRPARGRSTKRAS